MKTIDKKTGKPVTLDFKLTSEGYIIGVTQLAGDHVLNVLDRKTGQLIPIALKASSEGFEFVTR
jgi:hypothetical protein